MKGKERLARALVRRYATAAMVLFPAVAVVTIAVGSGLLMVLANVDPADAPSWLPTAATVCVGSCVVAAAAGIVASLVWVFAGPESSDADGVFHGPTRHPRMQDRMRVVQAATAMSDAELAQAIRALAGTEDQLLMNGRGDDAARVASDRAVCLAVLDRRRHARGTAAH